jgi:ribosomal protein S18 acetylase RimI-like enzyme
MVNAARRRHDGRMLPASDMPPNGASARPRVLPAESTLRRAQPADVPALAGVLARAFDQDPFYNWLVLQDERRVERAEWVFDVMLRRLSSELSEAYTTDQLGGVSVWRREVDIPFGQQLRLLPLFARATGWARIPATLRMFYYLEAQHQRLMPEPHYYLFLLGVEPARQGQGVGSQLITPMLARCDREQARVYLETSRADNLPFYERHGFEVVEVVERGGWPNFWLMIRKPAAEGTLAAGRRDLPA